MTNTADLRAAAEAATQNGKWATDHPGIQTAFTENRVFEFLASPDRILGILKDDERKTAALKFTAIPTLIVFAEENSGAAEALRICRAALEGKPAPSSELEG